jgi:hypothetical protein
MTHLTTSEEEEFFLALGIEPSQLKPVECGNKPPRVVTPVRFTNWSDHVTFTFSGYVARVARCHCTCDNTFDLCEGVFYEETHTPSGARRLRALADPWELINGSLLGGRKKEVEEREVIVCGECIGGLGFDKEVRGRPLAKIGEPWLGEVEA